MKISYKNTALNHLNEDDDEKLLIPNSIPNLTDAEKKTLGNQVLEHLKKNKAFFTQNIKYITAPFFDAAFASLHKLGDLMLETEVDTGGTFIFSHEGLTSTIFYNLKTDLVKNSFHYLFIAFQKSAQDDYKVLEIVMYRNETGGNEFMGAQSYKDGYTEEKALKLLVALIFFIKFAPLETKIIKGGAKGYHSGNKYVNETKNSIEVLDSTWFTNIVRSDGFKVRGHFRLQPCGPGLSQKKLIWVADFEKHGYTIHAKKEQ